MSKNRLASNLHLIMLTLAITGAAGLATGCEFFNETSIAKDVKESTGMDVNSPVQVAGAALAANVKGNQDEEDGLDVLQGYQRASHEQKGADYDKNRQYTQARDEYQKALEWTNSGDAGAPERAKLFGDIGTTYRGEGTENSITTIYIHDPVSNASLHQLAAQKFQSAAEWFDKAAKTDPAQYSYYHELSVQMSQSANDHRNQAKGK